VIRESLLIIITVQETKQPHRVPSPFCHRRLGFRPIYGACLPCGIIRERRTPARSHSFCAPEERQRSEPAAPATGRPKRKHSGKTTAVAARRISPRERSEPPRQPGGFSAERRIARHPRPATLWCTITEGPHPRYPALRSSKRWLCEGVHGR
jgi:hypothetical protein